MIDKTTRNPYDLMTYKNEKVIVRQKEDQKDLLDYRFEFELSGDGHDRKLLMTTGYIGGSAKESDNYFFLDEDTIDKLIEKLEIEKARIKKASILKQELKKLHDELNGYMKNGYVESIDLIYKPNSVPPYFNNKIYKAYIIKPNFKPGCPQEVNTAFNFLEVLHLTIDEKDFDRTMNYIRDHNDIPINMVGFSYAEMVNERKKEAEKQINKKSAEDFVNRHTKEQTDYYYKKLSEMGIPN